MVEDIALNKVVCSVLYERRDSDYFLRHIVGTDKE